VRSPTKSIVFVIGVALFLATVNVQPVFAVPDCSTEKNMFSQKLAGDAAYGSAGTIYVRNRDLALCSDAWGLSSANVHNPSFTRMGEIGFSEWWSCY
jgi:hypothetical protein